MNATHKAQSAKHRGSTHLCCVFCLALIGLGATLPGCAAGKLIGAMAEAEESQRLVETPPRYRGLENRTVAVVVQTDYATMFEHPGLVSTVTGGVTAWIGRHVPNAQVLSPDLVLEWQYRTPQWNALPLGDLPRQLTVDRVVFIDVLEYRLNPPGNRYLWDGVAVSRVGVVEADGLDPDAFVDTFEIVAKFPDMEGVGRESATASQIETGLLREFVKRNAWPFHLHYEPKYPDKYRPSLDTKEIQELKRATGS